MLLSRESANVEKSPKARQLGKCTRVYYVKYRDDGKYIPGNCCTLTGRVFNKTTLDKRFDFPAANMSTVCLLQQLNVRLDSSKRLKKKKKNWKQLTLRTKTCSVTCFVA